MTENNAKIHVLADETLGGIKREYVEVDRKAEVGEKIVIVEKADCEEWYKNGDVFTVDREYRPADGDVESDGAASDMNTGGLIYRGEYRVLEPTNIVHIDDPDGTERYEMVDRKAEVGEKVICLDDTGGDLTIGGRYTIDEIIEEDGTGYGFIDDVGEERAFWDEAKYRVLVPVEPQPSDLIDVIANLATRVSELERQVKKLNAALPEDMKLRAESTQRYLALQDEIDTLHKDSRRHGEELEALKYAAKETDGKVAHLEADSDMRLFTAEEVATLLNAMRERQ
ncbi:ELKS/Rab6-interacting/CAST family protein [Bacillus glycinifermentans]|uniref:ELKS/Rab6-interacting/CAST family protein n=1 Tax=Bacillus glycinifermentans TaxID=1664069 RepID=UPI001FF64046|nr:ELKS/Rab6-interacting/CAST family protein [Bacillus glycinifermentans]UOY86828.1 ELKS/Rab6-interacting/CAST family protein [Bacillus glycinifermentans]